MVERILDLCPMNAPRYDAWERAKERIPALVSKGAVDLSKYGIELSCGPRRVVVEGNHRVARILQLGGNLSISGFIENHHHDNIRETLIKDAKHSGVSNFQIFLALCEQGLYPWEDIQY
jgi:hypothetical protein